MGIDLSENGNGYKDLLAHIGHKIVCSRYFDHNDPKNVTIECEDCNMVLVNFNKPQIEVTIAEMIEEFSKAIEDYEEKYGYDHDLRLVYTNDREDLTAALELFKNGDMLSSWKKICSLDTIVRDAVPTSVYDFLANQF